MNILKRICFIFVISFCLLVNVFPMKKNSGEGFSDFLNEVVDLKNMLQDENSDPQNIEKMFDHLLGKDSKKRKKPYLIPFEYGRMLMNWEEERCEDEAQESINRMRNEMNEKIQKILKWEKSACTKFLQFLFLEANKDIKANKLSSEQKKFKNLDISKVIRTCPNLSLGCRTFLEHIIKCLTDESCRYYFKKSLSGTDLSCFNQCRIEFFEFIFDRITYFTKDGSFKGEWGKKTLSDYEKILIYLTEVFSDENNA